MAGGVVAEISIPWHHWMPKIESPGVLDARKYSLSLNGNPAHRCRPNWTWTWYVSR